MDMEVAGDSSPQAFRGGGGGEKIPVDVEVCLRPTSTARHEDVRNAILTYVEDLGGMFFFTDPLDPHPHATDVGALIRMCDLNNLMHASNPTTGDALVRVRAQLRQQRPGLGVPHVLRRERACERIQLAQRLDPPPLDLRNLAVLLGELELTRVLDALVPVELPRLRPRAQRRVELLRLLVLRAAPRE